MSKTLSKMNLISVVQQLPKEDIETIQGYVEMIEEENKKLKKKYENAVADYETTMAENKELKKQVEKALNDYCRLDAYNRTQQKELKKQLKDKTEDYRRMKDNFDGKVDVLTKIETQQKEFIKYLEDEMSKWHNNYDSYNYEYEVEEPTAEELINKILQKYKEIIGDINDKK